MGADSMLDFIVEYKVWFIIGGAIILLAIVGFIADKKKVLPNTKKEKKKEKLDIEEENTKVEENIPNSQMVISSQDIDKLNQEMKEDGNKEEASTTWELDNSKGDNVDNTFSSEVQSEPNYNEIHDEQTITNEPSEGNINNEANSVNEITENFEEQNTSDAISEEPRNLETSEPKEEYVDNSEIENEPKFVSEEIRNEEPIDVNDATLSAIVQDINKIENMDFSTKKVDIDIPEDKVEEMPKVETSNIAEKAANDELEDTMQISYSQLKEMVEDIIAENQKENPTNNIKEQETNESQSIQSTNSDNASSEILDMPLPKLDNITVDSINRQDEDEDDVWKF